MPSCTELAAAAGEGSGNQTLWPPREQPAGTGPPGKEGFLWQDESPRQGRVPKVRMGLPADLDPYWYNGLSREGTVPCPLLGMGGTPVGSQLWVQRGAGGSQGWQGLCREEGSVLAGTLGGLAGLCRGLGLAVTGVRAGFRDSGVCTGMPVPVTAGSVWGSLVQGTLRAVPWDLCWLLAGFMLGEEV